MGAGVFSSEIFYTIANGKIVRRFKEATANTVERVISRGPNAGKVVFEQHYDYLEGFIKNIIVKKTDYGRQWEVILQDNEGTYKLQLDYSSGYSAGFLKTLPNVDFDKAVRLIPKLVTENNKKKATIFIRQGTTYLKRFFTKETPNGLPELKQIMVKGELVWDDSEMMAFLERMVERHILPMLNVETQSPTDHLAPEQNQALNDMQAPPPDVEDELPF